MQVYKVKILEQHLDTFGHVNNATYLTILEEARWELMTSQGYSLADVQKKQLGPVILEVNLKFIKELRLRQTATITTELLEYRGKIGKLRQKILSESGELMTDATFVFGLFDMKQRKLIEPSPEWLAVLQS